MAMGDPFWRRISGGTSSLLEVDEKQRPHVRGTIGNSQLSTLLIPAPDWLAVHVKYGSLVGGDNQQNQQFIVTWDDTNRLHEVYENIW